MTTPPRWAGKRLVSRGEKASEIFAQNLWRELSDAGCEGFAADDWRRRRVPASVVNGAQTQEASETSDQVAIDPAATNATLRASSLSSSPFCSDEEFDSALAPEHIINALAGVRINCASKVRPRAVLQRHFLGIVDVPRADEVRDFCLPRRQWQQHRPHLNQKLRGSDRTLVALRRTMLAGFHKPAADRPDWAQRLHEFVDTVRARALGPAPISFSKPEIIVVGEQRSKSRLIALFTLGDRIIDKLVSKYLRVRFDALLSDSAFAYRAAPPGQAQPTQYDIIRRIQAPPCLQDRDRDHWIAGSDIRKCFDCFPHSLAMAAFRAASRTAFALGAPIDCRAARIYRAYLDCYDYRSVIYDSTDPELCEFRTRTETAWPINELRGLHGSNFDCERIGVPQGMALSMLTSNLLLSAVDFQVVDFCREHRISIQYFRYSDDARFICESADECQTVFDVFVAAASRLKLLVHPPSDERSADAKTSKPRRLAEDTSGTFVGYEFWPNGQVCVRKSSVQKHRAKRWKLIATIIAHLKRYPLRTSPEQLLKSVGERLMRMSTPDFFDSDFCWAAGFRVARGTGRKVEAQARELDRMHGSQMAALTRALGEIFGRKISKSHVPPQRNFRTYFECFRRPHRSPTRPGAQ